MTGGPYAVPTARRPSRSRLVERLREEVGAWRSGGYPGVSATTRRLLEHWFLDAHQTPDGQPFAYFFAQREALETIVYLHEVSRTRTTTQLLSRYADEPIAAAGLPYPRYVTKMATGSGKTKVMSLAFVWSYFHALREAGSDLTTTALVVAPNLIVFERLREDFEHGAVFRRDPLIPPEWSTDFDLQVVLRDDPAPVTATGVLWLTNVHVLYERRRVEPADPVAALLGPVPLSPASRGEPPLQRLARRGRVLVLNDEAHHLHDEVRADTGEPLVALQALQRLHETSAGVVAQLDFSATPRGQRGQPFPEVVSDYPLAAAIEDGIVKRPIIGELGGELEAVSDDAGVRYRQRILAGVARWRDDVEAIAPTGRNPLLFVMAEDTTAADQIAAFLETLPDLTGRVLTIHVNLRGANSGNVRTDDLERARTFARQADDPDNPYRAIVSVLMLREGWDVRNVTVVVPLRALTARAQILPEQTLGRGLRRMTRPGSDVDERVVVIEHEAFRQLWDDQLSEDDLDIERRPLDEVPPAPQVIAVEPERVADFDIDLPRLGRHLTRSAREVERLRLDDIPVRRLLLSDTGGDDTIEYTGRDLLTQEVVEKAVYPLPRADDPAAVQAWYVNEIQREGRLTGQFAVLVPLFRDYVERRVFGRRVSLDDAQVLAVLATPLAQETILGAFRSAVDAVSLVTQDVRPEGVVRPLSATRPFLWSGDTAVAAHSVFPLQPCDSGLEVQLVGFMDRCRDVRAFAKLAPSVRLSMEYRNADGRLAFYYPDFAVRLSDGEHRLVETKGAVDMDVPAKDRRAAQWTVDATVATGVRWSYLRVDQDLFDRQARRLTAFAQLEELVWAQRREEVRPHGVPGRLSLQEHIGIMDRMSESIRSSGEVPDVDDALRRFRDDPRGG